MMVYSNITRPQAQEEDQKVNEIAFINTLEAQNRKMELLSKEQMAEAKRAEIQVRQQVGQMMSHD